MAESPVLCQRPDVSRRIHCSRGFWLLLAALIYLDGCGIVLWSLLACAVHELGHWLVIRLAGGRVSALRLTAAGAEMTLDSAHPLSYGGEVAAALAGPAADLLSAGLCARCGWYLPAGLCLCFGALNLIPALPLDGGRALSFALAGLEVRGAERVQRAVSAVCSGALLGLGWAAWRSAGNLSLLCTALWLGYHVLKS